MERLVARRTLALALAVALTLIAAQPAAAWDWSSSREPGLWQQTLDWMTGFWGQVWNPEPRTSTFEAFSTETTTDRGAGSDPNGSDISSEPTPGTDG